MCYLMFILLAVWCLQTVDMILIKFSHILKIKMHNILFPHARIDLFNVNATGGFTKRDISLNAFSIKSNIFAGWLLVMIS